MKISNFRPIYYLGSKLSFVSAIEAAVNDVSPGNGRVCDLFSGSGVVGAALSASRPVTAVDIQEYSRVLSSALLLPPSVEQGEYQNLVREISESPILAVIRECVKPLITYESDCIALATHGSSIELVNILEGAPLAVFADSYGTVSSRLDDLKRLVVERLMNEGVWESRNTTVLRYFGGIYFSYYQAIVLDAILSRADMAADELKDTLKAAALSTASTLVNTVGKQFAQPIRPRNKDGSIKLSVDRMVQRDRSLDTLEIYGSWLSRYATLPQPTTLSQSLQVDYCEALMSHGSTFSVVYADPPYTRDHYSRFYHVLETMCLRDNPAVSKVVKSGKLEWSRGVYREDRHQSAFCIRSTAPEAFESLFRMTRQHDLPLVLSYSPHEKGDGTHPRVVSTSQIMEIAHSFYKKVELVEVDGIVHNQLNRNDLKLKKRDQAEILVKCFLR